MRVIIAGAGIAGLATAVALAKAGHDVTVMERFGANHALGSGITLIGPAIRVLDRLGLYDKTREIGYEVHQLQENDWHGDEIRMIDLPSATGDGGPGIMGMMRPALHEMLTQSAQGAGARIEWRSEVVSLDEDENGVTVSLADGSTHRCDLVVGADGLRSTVRGLVLGDYPVVFRDQGCFRAVVPRPAAVRCETSFSGYPKIHPGLTPLGDDIMYVYCTALAADTSLIPQAEIPDRMRELLAPFGGIMAEIRESIVDPELVNYRPFETILVPLPWNRGRVVLVGDAVHCTTPHLAAGGAMCLEDAAVLAEEIEREDDLLTALQRYGDRRFPRASFVVETSVSLAQGQVEGKVQDQSLSDLKIAARQLLAGAF